MWIARQGGCGGVVGDDRAPPAVLLEPAERGTMSPRQAARYVATFNRVASANGRPVVAVALPVKIRYEGEPAPGATVDGCL